MARNPTPAPQVDVPTMEQFNALEKRVTVLENTVGAPTPPNPEPEPKPPNNDGVQATRISNLIELFGVNTFSSMDQNNIWGSWPADYRPDTVNKALRYMIGNSGFSFRIREYHYKGRENFQKPWLKEIMKEFPDTKVAICPGANANVDVVPSMMSFYDDGLAHWVEGLNEPNTDFGSGEVKVDQTMAIQQGIWDKLTEDVMGPSIVAGMPVPEGWVRGYFGNQMDAANKIMNAGNGHYYPPSQPDDAKDGCSVGAYVGGLWLAYDKKPIHLTEWHPTLYNQRGVDQGGPLDNFYNLLCLLRSRKNGVMGLWWYALFDYGTVYKCGLFPTSDKEPRPAAEGMKRLCSICADTGAKYSFTPGKLHYEITGLNEECGEDLYQNSAGKYFLFIWRSSAAPGDKGPLKVQINFKSKRKLAVHDLLAMAPSIDAPSSDVINIDLDPGVHVVTIE